ncbi:MAG: hypothetical protein MK211_02630 [Flavobacteriales bacterium]|jgi:hypothetical protein|uniref:hypothetical protein n=1 Tax=Candidatus Ulvibacter alkanivorans TaxID=2267620 RepID=UPI000DF4AA65|nr:hypothetical protein [Candidatus Ulvibacter alkanivorans]MCH2489024.1 hypothetical protein [Flavobacteriales bacterium]
MKHILTISIFFFFFGIATAQIEKATPTVRIEAEETNNEKPSGLELPKREIPGLTKPKDPITPTNRNDLGKEDKTVDITKGDGLIDYKTNKAPKYFTKDKEALAIYGRDQNLGEVITSASAVNFMYRDHEYVDGDRIRVYVNGDIVRANVGLFGSFQGFDLPLQEGLNRVEFEALNQGSSGPNTAELHVYDDKGLLISAKKWNLLTGNKATIMVIKEQ